MAKDGRRKNRRPSVPVAADSRPTKHRTSKSSCPSGADIPSKNSTSNPNIESLEWVTCKQEEELDKFIRKKLDHLYGQALSTLVYMGYHEDVVVQGLLERGYCVGERDSLSNVVQNSLEFLTGKDVVESEQDRPQRFKNLELLVDFNLHFLVYILQKYSPNLNRMSILRSILMTDLNLNRAITMNMPFDTTDMPSDLNLEDDNGEIDEFLALEISEMLNNLNILDESVVSEDMKDAMMIDDLKPQLKKRIRWASKKVAQARKKQPSRITSLLEEIGVLQFSIESKLRNRVSALLSAKKGLDNAEKTMDCLKRVKEEIKAEMSASKLLESETKKKCLQVSKKGQLRQKVKLREEIELAKEKISKLEQQLVENDAAITQAQVKMNEAKKTRHKVIAVVKLENKLALEKWDCLKRKVGSLTTEERAIIDEHVERLKKLLLNAINYKTEATKIMI